MTSTAARRPFPPWLKKRLPAGPRADRVREVVAALRLNTVCQSARCPNAFECFARGTATFLVMGPNCTRRCRFCAVGKGEPSPLDPDEPLRVARAARALGLKHVVVTSVTRDDLADGGAGHFAETITAVKETTGATVEVLVPDFAGSLECVAKVLEAEPDVFNHNVETVPRLYGRVRPGADYRRSLAVLSAAAAIDPSVVTKSGLMLGLGERIREVGKVFEDLRAARCQALTAGQYLSPSRRHLPVVRFVEPGEFESLERQALEMGFRAARCAPLVRSSYRAEELFRSCRSENGPG